jgi:threonine aldolase
MNFASDNTAGVAPDILRALMRVNDGYALGYGNDDLTRRVEKRIAEIFEHEVAVYLVATGTAANAIALAQITPPFGAVFCHDGAHIMTDECGAPEFFGGGSKLIGIASDDGKIPAASFEALLAQYSGGHRPHQVVASALSLTQTTEAGTIYRPDEVAALAAIAHARGLKVHMDGARFANALVRLNASPADVTWRAGVDVLSLGATKGGALAAEAIVFFDPKLADTMPERRKRGGHLLSKHRYLAAQMDAFLEGNRWLDLARHANQMADRLASRLKAAGIRLGWPIEANLLFPLLPAALHAKLQAAGASYYEWPLQALPPSVKPGKDDVLARLVTSFATRPEDVDRFADCVGAD